MKRRQSHPRIQATITGNAGKASAIETHERNVLAITRAIHRLTSRRKRLQAELKTIGSELRARRRELRAVLQHDATVTHEDDRRLQLAGKADAIDAVDALRHRSQPHIVGTDAPTPENDPVGRFRGTCPDCAGTGHTIDDDSANCSTCQGTGRDPLHWLGRDE